MKETGQRTRWAFDRYRIVTPAALPEDARELAGKTEGMTGKGGHGC